MPAGQPDPITMHTESIARARLEADLTIVRLTALFDEIIHAMEGMTQDGFPMAVSGVDFKHPVGNAAWREHTRKIGRHSIEIPLMLTEDELIEDMR